MTGLDISVVPLGPMVLLLPGFVVLGMAMLLVPVPAVGPVGALLPMAKVGPIII